MGDEDSWGGNTAVTCYGNHCNPVLIRVVLSPRIVTLRMTPYWAERSTLRPRPLGVREIHC